MGHPAVIGKIWQPMILIEIFLTLTCPPLFLDLGGQKMRLPRPPPAGLGAHPVQQPGGREPQGAKEPVAARHPLPQRQGMYIKDR